MNEPKKLFVLIALLTAGLVLAGGCGDDGGDGMDDAGDGMEDAGDGMEDAGDGMEDAGDGMEDAGDGMEDAGGDDAGPEDADIPDGGAPPMITMVAWEHSDGCSSGSMSDVTVTTTVNDADTAAGELTFSGSATGCTGNFDSADATISCPQLMAYPATVSVEDPEGNSDSLDFSIPVCTDGTATP